MKRPPNTNKEAGRVKRTMTPEELDRRMGVDGIGMGGTSPGGTSPMEVLTMSPHGLVSSRRGPVKHTRAGQVTGPSLDTTETGASWASEKQASTFKGAKKMRREFKGTKKVSG